jgi:hypothetical protein
VLSFEVQTYQYIAETGSFQKERNFPSSVIDFQIYATIYGTTFYVYDPFETCGILYATCGILYAIGDEIYEIYGNLYAIGDEIDETYGEIYGTCGIPYDAIA